MAVIDERYNSRRDVGKPALGAYLAAFVGEREAMNAQTKPDTKGLMDAEVDARKKAADLRERKAILSGRREELKSKSSDKAAELKTKIAVANIAAQAKVTSADRAFRLGMQELYSDRAEKVAAKLAVPSEAKAVIDSATAPTTGGVDTESAMRSAIEKAGFPKPGTAEYDTVSYAMYRAIAARDAKTGGNEAGAFAEQAFGKDVDPNEYMYRAYAVRGPREVEEDARRVSKEIGGAGANPAVVDGWIKDTVLPSEETTTEERTRGTGPDDPDALEDAAKKLDAYADQLADERHRSVALYPRGHSFLLNPNTYTGEEGWRALGEYGENDPEYNRQVLGELQHEGGNVLRAEKRIGEMGGLDGTRGKEYVPDLLDTGLDLGGWLGDTLEKHDEPYTVQDGEWAYEVKPDRSITIVAAPKGHRGVGRTVTEKDGTVYKAIVEKIASHPETQDRSALGAILASQPKDVQDLFSGAATLYAAGKRKEAADEARKVSADDVRFAYADALERDPETAVRGILMLPEGTLGTAGESVRRTLDTPVRSDLDVAAVRGNLAGIGRAIKEEQDPERRARKRGLATQEVTDTMAMRAESPPAPPYPFKQVGIVEPAPIYSRVGEEPLRLGYAAMAGGSAPVDVDDSDIDDWFDKQGKK